MDNTDTHADSIPIGITDTFAYRGELVHTAKLTEAIVREAREAYAKGNVTAAGLSRKYGVSAITMRLALRGKTWKHVR